MSTLALLESSSDRLVFQTRSRSSWRYTGRLVLWSIVAFGVAGIIATFALARTRDLSCMRDGASGSCTLRESSWSGKEGVQVFPLADVYGARVDRSFGKCRAVLRTRGGDVALDIAYSNQCTRIARNAQRIDAFIADPSQHELALRYRELMLFAGYAGGALLSMVWLALFLVWPTTVTVTFDRERARILWEERGFSLKRKRRTIAWDELDDFALEPVERPRGLWIKLRLRREKNEYERVFGEYDTAVAERIVACVAELRASRP